MESQSIPDDSRDGVVVIQTGRLTLRRFVPNDLPALAAMYADPDVRRFFPDKTLSSEQTRRELEWFLHGHPRQPQLGLWATIERSTGEFLGRCGLLPWTLDGVDEVELAFLIDKRRWGEGFATEAAAGIVRYARDELGLNRLICLIMPGNLASVRVAQKTGMCFERNYMDELGPCEIWGRSWK
jgi:ribosomal-protein-alanine N-acetyltransferase